MLKYVNCSSGRSLRRQYIFSHILSGLFCEEFFFFVQKRGRFSRLAEGKIYCLAKNHYATFSFFTGKSLACAKHEN